MITPRRTRLVRAADLHAFRHVIAALSLEGDVEQVRARLVVVPTRGAARQLRQTLENGALGRTRAVVLPDLVTRDQLYDRLHARLAPPPPRLSAVEREAIMQAAAARAHEGDAPAPFGLRPSLVAAMLEFYDQLRRQRQSVARFEELLAESLGRDTELDRGARGMLQQTRFLAAAYREYAGRLAALGACDEHALRDSLVAAPARDPVRHIVVTSADWIADPGGLYAADFDLLTRLPGLGELDVVATAGLLGSGFHQRLHDWLPDIEETDADGFDVPFRGRPSLAVPEGVPEPPLFVSRDREEELAAVARRVKADPAHLDRTAIVYRRPLPYLYLATEVFGSAGVPYQAFDALPLAAEPFVAAFDVVLEFVSSEFTRPSIVALLRSPHLRFEHDGRPISRHDVAMLDRALSDARYLGGLERLGGLLESWSDGSASSARFARVVPALAAAAGAASRLQPLGAKAPASQQVTRLVEFLVAYARPLSGDESTEGREPRTRATLVDLLRALAAAHAAHFDPDTTVDAIAADIRRWIEGETFVPDSPGAGLQIVDAQAARYGDFDDVTILGFIEGEWPEGRRRNIFYGATLLAALGWPSEKDRRGAATAAFIDLVGSPARRTLVSTFTLDDEALVEPSSLVDDLPRAGLARETLAQPSVARIFADEALSLAPPALDALDADAREWAVQRIQAVAPADARYHGQAGPQAPRPLSVSAIETYLACPFKFFAQYGLRLEDEPEDDEVMDPRRQGQFLHAVFQSFFESWQRRGHRAITADNLPAAREVFAEIAEARLLELPEAEASLERTRLFGSPVAPGLAEIVFRMEAGRPVDVVERLLEYKLEGEFEFEGPDGPRRVALRGVADRIDLLADGTIRLIDYKLSSTPAKSRALQLPIYGLCAEQRLGRHAGRRWVLGEAAYITFRGARRVHPLFGPRANRDQVLKEAQERLVAAVGAIERGEFPPTPDDVFLCGFCSYAAVCRKDYVGEV